jgi:hypothetical protein
MRDVYADKPSTTIIAHSGFGAAFELDLSTFKGAQIKGVWLDPRTGKRTDLAEITAGPKVGFKPPSSGGVTDDWVLVLTRG